MTRPAYDVDLDAWRNKFAFHPADTTVKQLGHQLARKAVMALAELLHWLIPPSDDKSTAFRLLGDVLMYSNRALATGGGPRIIDNEAYTEITLQAALRTYEATALPEDPRIREYEAQQRGEHPVGSPSGLVGADPDASTTMGVTGGLRQEAPDAAVYGEAETEDPETFRAEFEDGDVTLNVVGGRGYVALAVVGPVVPAEPNEDGKFGWYTNLSSPHATNQVLSAIAAAGDRAFTS
jgi:hypothetical protein